MESCHGVRNGTPDYLESNDGADLDMVNWEQLEQELFDSRSRQGSKNSRLLTCLNLREEIRRQLAEDDAKKSNSPTNNKMRKSKSGFLDETSSSDSDHEELVNVPLTDDSTATSAEDLHNDQDFYLNHEFLTKVTLKKVTKHANFRSADARPNTPKEHMVVRPIQSRPSLKTRIQNQKDLQICFLSDFPNPQQGSSTSSGRSSTESGPAYPLSDSNTSNPSSIRGNEGPALLSHDFWSPPAEPSTRNASSLSLMPKSHSMFEMETEKQKLDKLMLTQFEETEAKWKQEMQSKIQSIHQHIHLQMQRQRRRHKKSPISTKVQLPYGKTRLDRAFLSDLNITHLQIILNDLHSQIEALNEELVRYLEERDELHMEQDSKLVDIDDLSRRLKELWIVTCRRKDVAVSKDCRQPLNGSSDVLVRRNKDQGETNGFPNGNLSQKADQIGSSSPAATTPTTPGSLNGGLQQFRQRIRSLLY